MSRYFLAVPLPEPVKEILTAARPPQLPGIALVHPDQMHVTLHFLGERERHQIDLIKRSLQPIAYPRFGLDIRGVGTFPEKGPPRVVWAGIEECVPLSDLHRRIGDCLQRAIGFSPEDRLYKPHVTLARVNRPAMREQLQDDWERELSVRDVPVERFVLYESVSSAGKVSYREEASWVLTD